MTKKPTFFTKFTLHPRPGTHHILLTPHPLGPSVQPRPVQFRAPLHSACRDTAPKPSFDATTPRAPRISANARVGRTVPFFPTLRISVESFVPVRHLAPELCSSPYPKSQSCHSDNLTRGHVERNIHHSFHARPQLENKPRLIHSHIRP